MRWTLAIIGVLGVVCMAAGRYQVGQSVSPTIYTEQFDGSDPAYKFFQTTFGDANDPNVQAAPDDWVGQFGDSERTLLLHTISELRVVVASQGRKLMDLESRIKEIELRHEETDPNGGER